MRCHIVTFHNVKVRVERTLRPPFTGHLPARPIRRKRGRVGGLSPYRANMTGTYYDDEGTHYEVSDIADGRATLRIIDIHGEIISESYVPDFVIQALINDLHKEVDHHD